MKSIKPFIATAAAIACSLGSPNAAKAYEMSPNELTAFNYGFASAAVMNICMNLQFGEIDSRSFVSRMQSVKNLEGVTPQIWSTITTNPSNQACGAALNRYGFTSRSEFNPAFQMN